MPFVPEEPQSEHYSRLQRRQIVVWSFLIFMMLTSVAVLLYISYQVMKGKSQGGALSSAGAPVMTPLSRIAQGAASPQDDHYFLYGQFSAQDSKYRIYRVFYRSFAKEELFSFLWRDSASRPSFAFYRDNIAVFPDANKGFFVSPEGKMMASPEDFVPPDAHFSVSPDKKRMFYFTYLSSIGTTSLTLRDMEKGKDIFRWPVSSSASQVCDFTGWSQDGVKAYCLAKNGGVAALKAFNAVSHAVNVIASKTGITDAAYYPKEETLLAVSRGALSLFDRTSTTWRELVSAPAGISFENALLIPDGSGMLYTVRRTNNVVSDEKVYFAAMDGSGQRELQTAGSARLVSVSPDSRSALLESPDPSGKSTGHYAITAVNGESAAADLNLTEAPVSATQFIGWSK